MDMHIIGYLIFLICAAAIIFWLLSKIPLPEPFNYIVYGVLALVALYILGSLLGIFGARPHITGWLGPVLNIPALA